MRLLVDENIPGDVVEALRNTGYDVRWVRIDAPGSSDTVFLRQAHHEQRVILTFDKDFGELAFRAGLPPASGIILCRFPLASPAYIVQAILAALATRDDWQGHFAVIEPHRIRMRPLHS